MGKKIRTAPGRRPILQLSPPCPRSITTVGSNSREEDPGSTSEDEQDGTGDGPIFMQSTSKEISVEAKPPAVKATEGLSLLGAYEDSDEEESPDSQPQPAKANHNQPGDIDSTLANFLAEIDAITTQPAQTPDESTAHSTAPPPTPPRPEPKDQPLTRSHTAAPNGTEAATTGAEFQYDTQYSLSGVGVEMGHWQEVWDENSGCFYYWNTETNEVTWQLPLDLVHQVQGLQHYTDSSTMAVNGSSAQSAVFYPEQNPVISTTVQITKKESKKEVMESVVALTSEEEERRGVAASLLAPLIPEEVKEAEERWRKKVVCLEEEGPGSEGEGPAAAHPVPTAVETRSHGDLHSNAHSGESSEVGENEEEETEEDTRDLELAELRALEEGDGSLTGSSPRSDVSHEGSRVELLKKGKWKTTFVRSASPDSNSRSENTGRDSPDPPETEISSVLDVAATSKGNETPVEEDEMDTEALSEKTKPKVAQKEEEDNVDLKFQIGELANTLTSKMEFLGINKKSISNFQLLLLQTETRIADWREGSLSGNYLKRKLQEAAEQIKHYEINATPKGWSCHWDRDHRRYFYVNDHTGASRWEFPDVEEEGVSDGKDMKTEQGSKDQGEPKPPADLLGIMTGPTNYMSLAPVPPGLRCQPTGPCPCPNPNPLPACDPLCLQTSHLRLHPSRVPTPPPPPPPLPPASEETETEIEEVEMEEDEGEPPAPGTEDDTVRKPLLPPAASSYKNTESAASPGTPAKAVKRKATASGSGQLQKSATIGSNAVLYSQAAVAAAPVVVAPVFWGVPAVVAPVPPTETVMAAGPTPPLQPAPSRPPASSSTDQPAAKNQPAEKSKKLKKDKAKKSKTKMPPLVQKWQSIQRELDDEENSSSSDEDHTVLNHKRIEEWKQQQLVTGKAGKSANFEALPEDWRDRLKRRKLTPST
ncbi:formin-binding protein 4 isoform X1 [Acipenser oxyrinchus oxyrinchus]|uniref:Formin-binding protein 4 isoform X1 n=1 Tax=Acipenser oxyrinchus oxyrinchus TaxID=40147 RepID=A0AAD8CZS4_ACIOX|nr:formin-binding protein 4 isoform X1 [Acipenser oxyrinchus oxyrinchus]